MDQEKENRVSKRNKTKHPHSKLEKDLCTKCGKTARTKPLSISLLKPEKDSSASSRKCKSRCKHKEELAKYTNVSVTTIESESEGDMCSGSFVSTVSTQITERSIRSLVRETVANKEIQKLQQINAQLTSQLDAFSKGATMRDVISAASDNTLTPNGAPAPLTVGESEGEETNDSNITLTNSPEQQTPKQKLTYKNTPYIHHTLSHHTLSQHAVPPHTSPRRKSSANEPSRRLSPRYDPNSKSSLDSGYTSVKAWSGVKNISRQLLEELEEENKVLRTELKTTVDKTQEIIILEKEIRRLKSESNEHKNEVIRLKDVETQLHQVEQFYYNEKKSYRCTIEDTLLTLEEFRQDKEALEKEIFDLKDQLKDKDMKKSTLQDHVVEQKNILTNTIEKLKLELETGQSENAMLQSRISTIEENCSFLEGQVQAMERDNLEKLSVITAAEQHARDMEQEIQSLRKESVTLHSEQSKCGVLESQIEELKKNNDALKTETTSLQEKLNTIQDQNSQLHTRLADLVKSHTKSEESVQQKERAVNTLKTELETLQNDNSSKLTTAQKDNEALIQQNKLLCRERDELSARVETLSKEIEYIEQAFFKGWSDQPEIGDLDEKTITFQDEHIQSVYPKAGRIIQTIKLDRQKLKAKLVRSVQDNKTLQTQLSETQDALDRESANLAKRLREALDELHEAELQNKVLERTASNVSCQVEELTIVNRGLELENYHLKKLTETLSEQNSPKKLLGAS